MLSNYSLLKYMPFSLITYIPEDYLGYCKYSKKIFKSGYNFIHPYSNINKVPIIMNKRICHFVHKNDNEMYNYEFIINYKYNNIIVIKQDFRKK